MKYFRKNYLWVVLLLCLSVYLTSRIRLQSISDLSYNSNSPLEVQNSPIITRLFSLEYDGLLADYLLLKIGAYTGKEKTQPLNYDAIYNALKQVYSLDPYFQQSYIIAQGILPWKNKVAEANHLLEISAHHRTWDWRPGYYAGTNCFYFLNDYAKAGRYFLQAARIKGAPILLALLGARFSSRVGNSSDAIQVLSTMIDNMRQNNTLPEQEKNPNLLELEHRVEALKMVLRLEKQVVKFKRQRGRIPFGLEELVIAGITPALPKNPYKTPFSYSWQTGKISFDQVHTEKNIDKKQRSELR